MPKQKTHSGTKRRFRVTRTGKVVARQKNRSHLLEKKSSRRTRRLAGNTVIESKGDAARIKRLLNR